MTEITGIHPYADKFPMLSDPELDELAESISTVGLLHAIVINLDGLILDGRNRLEACNRAQFEAFTEIYTGTDIAEYVIAANVTRRNLSTGQRAMATALVLEADGRRQEGRWRRGSVLVGNQESLISGQWQNILGQAGIILDYKPDLAKSVVNGIISLNDAFAQADRIRQSGDRERILEREKKKREQTEAKELAKRNAEIVADLTQAGANHYLQLIESGTMQPKAAWAAYREETRIEREKDEAERQVLRDRYTSMAQACLTASSWGEYEDFQTLMSEFDPTLLNPPQLDRYLEIESLQSVLRFVEQLISWRKEYVPR